MEIGWTPRSPMAADAGQVARVPPVAAAGPVRTELPPAETVRQPPRSASTNVDRRLGSETRRAAAPDVIDRRIEIDAATQEVVFQAVDSESGEVVTQVPDQAILRLRAYARAMRQADSEGSASRVEARA